MAKRASFQPEPRTVEKLEKIYPSLNFAANRALNAWVYLRTETLDELKKTFAVGELCYLIDLYNTQIFDPRYMIRRDVTRQEIEDGEKYEQLAGKWDVDLVEFTGKIEKLSAAQVFFLNEWAKLFWENNHYSNTSPTDYCSALV